ncbi:hypothetical protein [Bacillus sp. FJAT-52991]|uniref:Type II toxin-antitoxin system Phd/YefM family antitoxin n=1 Tax=Bacillus kandeliae TaxID=3129297 RepID=A0ABZ2NBD9_9BACI
MGAKLMEKPTFNADQLVSASTAAKTFGSIRKKAKVLPQFITDNGEVDTVVLEYKYYEEMYTRLKELEEKEEERVLQQRIERLEDNPSAAVSWRAVRRSE